MFGEYVAIRVLGLFLENPFSEFYLRQIAKETGVSAFSAKKYADVLHSEGFLARKKRGNQVVFFANRERPAFKQFKKALSVYSVEKSGLVEFLPGELSPSSVVLFGSTARGEDDKKSDLDILAISRQKSPSLEKFERRLGRKINLLVFSPADWAEKVKKDAPFYREILLDGILLFGEMPLA